MSQFIDLSRLNLLWPMFKPVAIEHGHFKEGALNMTFESYGYASLYVAGNMPMLLIAATVILGLWLLSLVKSYIVKNTNNAIPGGVRDIFLLTNHSNWLINFAVRFLYEVFMIVCISSLIALQKERQENVIPEYNIEHDPDAGHAIFDRVLAICLLIIVLMTLAFSTFRLAQTYICKK